MTKKGDLEAWSHDPCYLDKPSEARQTAYDQLRNTASALFTKVSETINSGDYATSRKQIGEVRSLELTSTELDKLREITATIPEKERPVQTPKDEYNREGRPDSYIESIDDAYGTRIESMSRAEFVGFAKKAVTGEIKQVGRHADTSYLFGIAGTLNIDPKTQEELVTACIESGLGKIRGKPYNHETDFHDKYNTEQALKYLAGIGTESSANKLFGYIRSFVDGGDYRKPGWREQDRKKMPEDFLFPAVEALSSHLSAIPEKVKERELPYLKKLKGFLMEHADEPITLNVLNRTLGAMQRK